MSNPDELDNIIDGALSSSNEDLNSRNANSARSDADVESPLNLNQADEEERDKFIQRVKAMTFTDYDQAYRFYFRYGQLTGFDVRKYSRHYKDKQPGIVANAEWVCSRQGKRTSRIKPYDRVRRPKENLRCECGAKFRVAIDSSTGKYKVTTFVPEHTHRLETPDTSHTLRCNRLLTQETKSFLENMTTCGFKPSQVMDFLEDNGGGSETHVLNRKDAYNYLNGERAKRIEGGDVNTMLGLIEGMKLVDPSLDYKHSVDINNSLTRIIWRDGISSAEYEQFGDVILFDSTYKTNMYRFPIVMVSGVNSHLSTCIFAIAIMYKETTEQYTWLLERFLSLMNGKAPQSVLTDQDGAMRAAIRQVFPNATHRLCSWHISRNAETNIKITGFSTGFSNLMHSPCSVPEFESRWSTLISKFDVVDHPWIKEIYSKRHSWAECYFRGKFFAMMRSTQRAESMNSFLKSKVRSGFSLTDLLRSYHNGFLSKIRNTFHDLQKISERAPIEVKSTGLLSGFENQVGRLVTRKVAEHIMRELKEETNIIAMNGAPPPVNRRHTFFLEDYSDKKPRKLTTIIDLDTGEFQCECKMLESDGIPCRHLIFGFKNLKLPEFPANTIHPRWFVDVGRKLTSNLPYQRTYKGHGKMKKGGILFKNSSDDDGDDDDQDGYDDENDTGDGTPPQSDGEGANVNVKRPPKVVDPDKIIPKGGTKSKRRCGICRKPGHKNTTCGLNPNPKAGRTSRAKCSTIRSARSDVLFREPSQDGVFVNMGTADSFRQHSESTSQFFMPEHPIGSHTSLLFSMHRHQFPNSEPGLHSQEEGTSNFNNFFNPSM